MSERYILLPCQGNPLEYVWLPQTRSLGALEIPMGSTSKTVGEAARDKALSLGVKDNPQVRPFARERIGGAWVHVWILWVKPGRQIKELSRVTVEDALADRRFGQAVGHLKRELASRR